MVLIKRDVHLSMIHVHLLLLACQEQKFKKVQFPCPETDAKILLKVIIIIIIINNNQYGLV